MILREIAHARAGDKGNISNICVIAYHSDDYKRLRDVLTIDRVRDHFAGVVLGPIQRYELPQLWALNFVMHHALGGGVTRSLALDAHGKCLSSILLSMHLNDQASSPSDDFVLMRTGNMEERR
jgi:hypothetical protein